VEHDDHVTFGDNPSHVSFQVGEGAHETCGGSYDRRVGRVLVEGSEVVPIHDPIDQIQRLSLVSFNGHAAQIARSGRHRAHGSADLCSLRGRLWGHSV
jgi:hypothetical protein